jgi:RNA polymerase sigma-70 factor (ECF subfamily)
MSVFDRARTHWFLRNILPHEPALRAWLSRMTNTGLDPDDIIQEAYSIFAGMESVADIRAPRAYLFQVARSIVTQHIRRARIVSIHAVDDIAKLDHPDDGASPEQVAIDRDELRELACAIAAMPARTREAFVLRRVKGLSQRDIASRMQVSENTVEKQISSGLRFLVAWFRDGGREQPQTSRVLEVEFAALDVETRSQSIH